MNTSDVTAGRASIECAEYQYPNQWHSIEESARRRPSYQDTPCGDESAWRARISLQGVRGKPQAHKRGDVCCSDNETS